MEIFIIGYLVFGLLYSWDQYVQFKSEVPKGYRYKAIEVFFLVNVFFFVAPFFWPFILWFNLSNRTE